jgi:predicted dithiol-disulfide oxidoreductase (DUF899 family)
MRWTFPWASSRGSDFNSDYSVGFTERQQSVEGVEYNYQRMPPMSTDLSRAMPDGPKQFAAMCGTDAAAYLREMPGMSSFVREGGAVYHAYSTYARGLDGLWGMYQWLDRAPKGRNENGLWWLRHDEYGKR